MPSQEGTFAPDDSRDERLYDEYLEALLHDRALDPSAFCEQHGGSEILKGWLKGAFEMLASSSKPSSPIAPPSGLERLGDYTLLRPIGEGGMGTVYAAEQTSLGRVVALKLIRPELVASPTSRARFEREARAIAKVRHPHIVNVFESGEQDGIQYFAMELVPGKSLQEVLEESQVSSVSGSISLEIPRVLKWMIQISGAVGAAHKAGVLHRDIKPSNIRINPNDDALLVDFGLARHTDEESTHLTHSFAGSPCYASPEQIENRSGGIDERSDVYALGTTLYQALTGTVPFQEESLERLMHRVMTAEPPSPSRLNPRISKDLETTLLCAMEKNPDRRYQTAEALGQDLEAILSFRPIQARPASWMSRSLKWVRRNPVLSVSLFAALCLLMTIPIMGRIQDHAQRERASSEAKQLVHHAQEELTRIGDLYDKAQKASWNAARMRSQAQNRWLSAEEDVRLKQADDDVRINERDRQVALARVFSRLSKAQQLDDKAQGLQAAWSGFYFQKWLDVRTKNPEVARVYRNEVEDLDTSGEWLARIAGTAKVTIGTDPPGADIYLYRYQSQIDVVDGGEHRQVLTPHHPSIHWPILPGSRALRVAQDHPDVEINEHIVCIAHHPIASMIVAASQGEVDVYDRLVAIDDQVIQDAHDFYRLEGSAQDPSLRRYRFERAGDEREDFYEIEAQSLESLGITVTTPKNLLKHLPAPVHILRGGKLEEAYIEPPLTTVLTASPFALGEKDRVGSSPITRLLLETGNYLLVVRSREHRDVRVPFHIDHPTRPYGGNVDVRVTLPPREGLPSDYIYVQADATHRGSENENSYWIASHEVTVDEYLEFLNSPSTLKKIKEEKDRTCVPNHPAWDQPNRWRTRRGRYFVPDELTGDMPVLGVRWYAANAFVEWKNEMSGWVDFEFALPTNTEWMRAVAGEMTRLYVYGDSFQPKWINSCFSRRASQPEPVGHYPIDESPYGIFDMSGSASEWCSDAAFDGPDAHRMLIGGAWNYKHPSQFQRAHRLWYAADALLPAAGIRLVIRPKGKH